VGEESNSVRGMKEGDSLGDSYASRCFFSRSIAQAGRPCHDGGRWMKGRSLFLRAWDKEAIAGESEVTTPIRSLFSSVKSDRTFGVKFFRLKVPVLCGYEISG
jgi:hypothetical protein